MNIDIELTNHLFKSVALLEKTGEQIFSQVGLTIRSYSVLSAIVAGAKTNSELVRHVLGAKSSVARKINWLEREGFVGRTVDDKDKRVWHFELTKKGTRVMDEVQEIYEQSVGQLYEDIAEEEKGKLIKQLENVEKKLVFHLNHGTKTNVRQK